MKRLILFSILLVSLFTPKANAISAGGCLLLPTPTYAAIAVTLAAYEGVKVANKMFWNQIAAYKKIVEAKKETKGN